MYTYASIAAWRISLATAVGIVASGLSVASSSAHAASQTPPSCINSAFADGHLVLHFDRPQRADNITLTTYNAPKDSVMRISNGVHSVALVAGAISDGRSNTRLRAPLYGTDFTVFISEATKDRGDNAVCITELQLRDGKSLLVPRKQAPVPQAQTTHLVGVWHSSITNHAKATLRFAADGNWTLQTSQKLYEGSWRLKLGQLQMRLKTDDAWVFMHLIEQVSKPSYAQSGETLMPGHTDLMLSAALIPELGGVFDDAVSI